MDCLECLYLRNNTKKGAKRAVAQATGPLSSFCAEHQVTIDPSPVARYGYYLARQAVRGDDGKVRHEEQFRGGAEGYAMAGRDTFIYFGLHPDKAGPYDGCAVHFDLEGKRFIVITAQNFFDDRFSVYVHEVKE